MSDDIIEFSPDYIGEPRLTVCPLCMQPPPEEWHPISEPPRQEGGYLVAVSRNEDDEFIRIFIVLGYFNTKSGFMRIPFGATPTHWMNLPPIPELPEDQP